MDVIECITSRVERSRPYQVILLSPISISYYNICFGRPFENMSLGSSELLPGCCEVDLFNCRIWRNLYIVHELKDGNCHVSYGFEIPMLDSAAAEPGKTPDEGGKRGVFPTAQESRNRQQSTAYAAYTANTASTQTQTQTQRKR